MNNEHEWKKELHTMLDKNIAVDGGAVATKYYHELVDFISSERQKAYEEGRGVKENVTTLKNKAYEEGKIDGRIEKAVIIGNQEVIDQLKSEGRQAAYTELLDEMPKERNNPEAAFQVLVNNGYNEALSAIRDLIEKKRV